MRSTPSTERRSTTKSGIMPRPVLEPDSKREPPMPLTHMEIKTESDTSSVFPDIKEGHDTSAIGDSDYVNGK